LECALSGKADYLVSGDKDVLEVKKFQTIKVLNAKGFLEGLKKLQFPFRSVPHFRKTTLRNI